MVGTVRNRRITQGFGFLVFLLFYASVSICYSQEVDSRKGPKHFIGVKAGQNFSWLDLEPTVQQNMVQGAVIGLSYTYMSQYFGGLLIEGQYIQYGWEEIFADPANSYSRKMNYLELPVLTTFVLGKRKTHFKMLAGVKIAMLLNELENSNLPEGLEQIYNGVEIKDRFELGLAFGGGISRDFPFGQLQLDTRFNVGLSNLFEATDDLSLLYSQNQALTVSLYYWFNIK